MSNRVSFGSKDGKKSKTFKCNASKDRCKWQRFCGNWISVFLIKNDKFIDKYNETWDKVSTVVRKGFDSEPAYNNIFLKSKTKPYEGKVNANFNEDKVLKEGSQCICLSVILIDSGFSTGKNLSASGFSRMGIRCQIK